MGVLQSNLFTSAGNNDLEDCAASHIFNFYKGKPANAARFEAINRIREALRRLGFPSAKDAAGVYGDDTARAVLAYKGPPRNILGPGQVTPDAVVGRQTIVRLDEELRSKGLDGELPGPPAPPQPAPDEGGRTDWLFYLSVHSEWKIFYMVIMTPDRSDYRGFEIQPFLIDDHDLGSVNGSTSTDPMSPFKIDRAVKSEDFDGASCTIALQKEPGIGNGKLSGFMYVKTTEAAWANVDIPIFDDHDLLSSLRSGNWLLRGNLQHRDAAWWRRTSGSYGSVGPSASPSARNLSRAIFTAPHMLNRRI